jgi:hypothetical protein
VGGEVRRYTVRQLPEGRTQLRTSTRDACQDGDPWPPAVSGLEEEAEAKEEDK